MSIMEKERAIEEKLYSLKKKHQWLRNVKRRLAGETDEVLTKQNIKEIIEFYQPFIELKETNSHEWYTKKTGEYFVNYIPHWVWFAHIDPFFNDVAIAPKMENKCFYENMFRNCKHPFNIAYRANGIWYTNEDGVISVEKLLQSVVKEKALFIKQANSSCGGFGVFKVDGENIVEQTKEVISKIPKDIVIQKQIVQADVLNSINPSSVNSIRVLSLLRPEGVEIYSMALRVGVGNMYVDNASSGGVMVGINPDGRLKEKAFFHSGDYCTEHPSTKTKFGDVVLPNIDKVKELVKTLHPQVPYFRLVSWDIILDQNDQPLLLEANLREGGIDIHQLTNGPVFGEDTIAILQEVFGKK